MRDDHAAVVAKKHDIARVSQSSKEPVEFIARDGRHAIQGTASLGQFAAGEDCRRCLGCGIKLVTEASDPRLTDEVTLLRSLCRRSDDVVGVPEALGLKLCQDR